MLKALFSNTTGNYNTANGFRRSITTQPATQNTATGFDALFSNTTGSFNTANGAQALFSNTTGGGNTANGIMRLLATPPASDNTANGFMRSSATPPATSIRQWCSALFNNTLARNIALGRSAGLNLTTGSNNIDIGNQGVAAEANTIRIGTQGTQTATFIAGISGTPLGAGVAVRVNANGQLGTVASSARFKQDIKPMDKASEAILALKPVTFRYKQELDPEGTPQFGLVAEEVEKVNPDLVARDEEGKVYTVRYEAVNAMLLNEFLKAHAKPQQQQATIEKQQKQIQALTTGLQKVSDQLELKMPSLRTADNH